MDLDSTMPTPAPAVHTPDAEVSASSSPKKRRIALMASALVVAAAAIYGYRGTFYEETDDAQIDGYISNVASRVAGTVLAVHVDDNQAVTAGQTLVELDPKDLRVAVDQARAALAQAEAQLRAEQPNVAITETSNATLMATTTSDVASGRASVAEALRSVAQAEAQLKQGEANDKLAQLDLERAERLYRTGAIAKAEYDGRQAAADASTANMQVLRETVDVTRRRVEDQTARERAASSRAREASVNAPPQLEAKRATVALRQASVDSAKAVLEQAELNLSYANLPAPVGGIIGKRSVNVGDRVNVGQQLLALTQTDKVWVTANYRETQVHRMQPGQHVTVHVDALRQDFAGEVESLAAATGSRYSVLPPENATGNYVKVVQRLPVRIRLLPGQPGLDRLRPGMSVEPEVRVK